MKKTVSCILLVMLSMSMFTLAVNIKSVKAQSGTIIINPDGSISSPVPANITSSDNVTYTFTGNNYLPIVVQRSNIVINGMGYTLQAPGGNGISLTGISNVTIKNTTLTNSEYGIYLNSSSDDVLSGNNVAASILKGVYLYSSSGNSLSGNNVASWLAIYLNSSCNNNILSGNSITGRDVGIGIELDSSSGNVLSDNNITNLFTISFGIVLDSSSRNVLSGNNINESIQYQSYDNERFGISLFDSPDNVLSGNVMENNTCSFAVECDVPTDDFVNYVDTSNLVNGKPVYYLMNQSNIVISPQTYPDGIGYLGLINCKNVTVQGLTLTKNDQGLLLANTTNSKITDNNITGNVDYGIDLYFSSDNNTLSGNEVANSAMGIDLEYSSDHNVFFGNNITANGFGVCIDARVIQSPSGQTFYHNNFINNTQQVYNYFSSAPNVWDDGYPSGGNYWSDYLTSYPNAVENDSSGIWNTPYVIAANNIDRYPLMSPLGSTDVAVTNVVSSKTVVGQGFSDSIKVTVANRGDNAEAFNVTVSIQGSSMITQYINSSIMRSPLSSGSYTVITFTWNTVSYPYGNYTISASVTLVAGETNNWIDPFTYGTVKVTIPGDINGDGIVNGEDLHILAFNWGLTVPPGNPNADIGGFGSIGGRDLHILAENWGLYV